MAKTPRTKSPLKAKTLLVQRQLVALLATAFLLATAAPALAAKCGNTSSGFERWKRSFAKEAAANGIGRRSIQALKATR